MQAKRQRLNRTQIGECLKLLDENGTMLDGLYKYNEGWDDWRLGEHFGVDKSLVGSLRRETRGKLWSEAKLAKAQAPTQPELPFEDPEVGQLRAQLASTRQAMRQQWATIKVLHDTMASLLNKLGEPPMTLKIPVEVAILLDTWDD